MVVRRHESHRGGRAPARVRDPLDGSFETVCDMARTDILSKEGRPEGLGAVRETMFDWSEEMVEQLTPSSNTPGDSNTLVSWLREVAALRQAA
jgi:hypothetical protein